MSTAQHNSRLPQAMQHFAKERARANVAMLRGKVINHLPDVLRSYCLIPPPYSFNDQRMPGLDTPENFENFEVTSPGSTPIFKTAEIITLKLPPSTPTAEKPQNDVSAETEEEYLSGVYADVRAKIEKDKLRPRQISPLDWKCLNSMGLRERAGNVYQMESFRKK